MAVPREAELFDRLTDFLRHVFGVIGLGVAQQHAKLVATDPRQDV